jgi:protein SCO1
MQGLARFFEEEGFAATALGLVAAYEVLVLVMLVVPLGGTGLAGFAEEFRTWCFGLDPATGHMQWSYVLAMTSPPVLLGLGVIGVWWPVLAAAPRARLVRWMVSSAAVLTLLAAGLAQLSSGPNQSELPFPGEAIRTAHAPPTYALVDHRGSLLEPGSFGGDVVVMTGVYAHCAHTCPLIFNQLEAALAELSPSERASVSVVGVTLDPVRDTVPVLADLASSRQLSNKFHLATGGEAEVNALLDRMEIARSPDPLTGVIDHANLFLVLDREGKVAYRLTLGDRQQRWLTTALRQLVAEGVRSARR